MGLISSDSACGEFFHCENSGECVDPSQVCNFHTDCPLGEEEGFICGEFGIFNKSLNCEIRIWWVKPVEILLVCCHIIPFNNLMWLAPLRKWEKCGKQLQKLESDGARQFALQLCFSAGLSKLNRSAGMLQSICISRIYFSSVVNC